MILIQLLLVFILGTFFGSFLCVLIDRLPRGEQVLSGRSYCEHCKHKLGPTDLIPVVSYLTFGGKCRYCHVKLPIHLLLIELFTGLLFAFLFFYGQVNTLPIVQLALLTIIFLCFAGIFFSDWFSGIIPDEFNVAIGVACFILLYFFSPGDFISNFCVGLLTFSFFLVLFLVTRGRGMGFGDVKLAFLLGFFLGFPKIVVGLYVAFLTAAAISVILIILKKKRLRGDTIAFGPFLIFGAFVAFFLGDRILGHFF